jgi:hypothetical protein
MPRFMNSAWVTIHPFIPLACAECDDSLPFSGTSSIPLCYVLFPATLLPHLFFHPLPPHLAIYFLVYLSILLFKNSYIILFWKFYSSLVSISVSLICFYLKKKCCSMDDSCIAEYRCQNFSSRHCTFWLLEQIRCFHLIPTCFVC